MKVSVSFRDDNWPTTADCSTRRTTSGPSAELKQVQCGFIALFDSPQVAS